MKEAKPQDLNRKNLIDVSTALKGIEHFVFFGTLLGLVRDGDIIPHDDDIDFYAPIDQRDALIERLKATDFVIEEGVPNHTDYFLQAYRVIDGVKTYVDFYLYQSNSVEDFIVDRWNFPGTPDDESTHLHIPKSLIYPLKTARFFDCDIAMPAKGAELCAFLYGADWQIPRIKNSEYIININNNNPSCQTLLPIPKIIYSLWMQGSDNAPDIVRINFDQWERLNPDYKLIVLDEKTAAPYLKDFPIDASALTPQTFSDILRVSVLAQTGGVWVDATVYPTMPLSRWLDRAMRGQTFFAYDNPHLYHMPVTSWFLAAREHCPMIAKWNDLIRRYWFMPRVAIHQENLTDEKRPDIYLPADIEAEMGLPDMRPTAGYPYFWLHHLFSHLLRYDSDFADQWKARYPMDYVPATALQNIYLNRFFYRTKTRRNKKRWVRHRAAFLLCRPLYLRRLLKRAPMQKLDWRYKKYPLNLLRNRK